VETALEEVSEGKKAAKDTRIFAGKCTKYPFLLVFK